MTRGISVVCDLDGHPATNVKKSRRPTRIIIRVQRRTGLTGWWVVVGGLQMQWSSQYNATSHAVELATRHEFGGGLAQVVLHGRDGRIRWERTYPRSSDPRRTKG